MALKIACHTVEMWLNCKIPSSYKKKHIKRNKRSSRRLMADQVASICRWGHREHAKPTPLFFTPTGFIWWAMEIRCRTPALYLGVVYANNDRGNNNNNTTTTTSTTNNNNNNRIQRIITVSKPVYKVTIKHCVTHCTVSNDRLIDYKML